jgi:hypothetical protein
MANSLTPANTMACAMAEPAPPAPITLRRILSMKVSCIKNELDGKGTTNTIKESIERKVVKTPSNGSSSNLIESKTYENPQFLRMKDLMSKIK